MTTDTLNAQTHQEKERTEVQTQPVAHPPSKPSKNVGSPAVDVSLQQAQANNQLRGMSMLMEIEASIRRAGTVHELHFLMVNELIRIVPYRNAVSIRLTILGTPHVESLSGLAKVDNESPYVHWIKKMAKCCLKQHSNQAQGVILTSQDVDEELRKDWKEYSAANGGWFPVISPQKKLMGGLWLSFEQDLKDADKRIIERLCETYAHALWALEMQNKKPWSDIPLKLKEKQKKILLITALVICFPVKMSVLAPAEIVPQNPWIATAPTDGVVKEILVTPNQEVKKGTVLFRLDETQFLRDYNLAKKNLDSAVAELRQTSQKAISSYEDNSAGDLALNQLQVKERQHELTYAKTMLSKVEIRAEADGIVIFADKNDWLGHPVKTGEQVMKVSNPKRVEIKANLGLDDAIALPDKTSIKIYLNANPLSYIEGTVNYVSYEAEDIGQGQLAYRVKASIDDASQDIRIGLKGTAKIYGEHVPLGYYWLRRPISYLKKLIML